MLTLMVSAIVIHEVSQWCADRIVGENERGRYAITYLWEGEQQLNGTTLCHPMSVCAASDMTGDGVIGGPDFWLLMGCIGQTIDDVLPVPAP